MPEELDDDAVATAQRKLLHTVTSIITSSSTTSPATNNGRRQSTFEPPSGYRLIKSVDLLALASATMEFQLATAKEAEGRRERKSRAEARKTSSEISKLLSVSQEGLDSLKDGMKNLEKRVIPASPSPPIKQKKRDLSDLLSLSDYDSDSSSTTRPLTRAGLDTDSDEEEESLGALPNSARRPTTHLFNSPPANPAKKVKYDNHVGKSSRTAVRKPEKRNLTAQLPTGVMTLIFKHLKNVECQIRSTTPSSAATVASEFNMNHAVQKKLMSLRSVCKAWNAVLQPILWESPQLRHESAVTKFYATIEKKPGLAAFVDKGSLVVFSDIESSSSRAIASLLVTVKSLQNFSMLTGFHGVKGDMDSFYMNKALLDALCASKLRSLCLDRQVTSTDLESILLQVPTLQDLVLTGGVEIGNDTGKVPSKAHQARLRKVVITNREGDPMGSLQLRWILAPSVGHLQILDLNMPWEQTVHYHGFHQSFATKAFADILVQLGPTLKILRLAVTNIELVIIASDLQVPPHLGRLDFGLSHCKELKKLETIWPATGPKLLDSLSSSSTTLEDIILTGKPEAITAAAFGTWLKSTQLPQLKTIELRGFKLSALGAGWASQALRDLAVTCETLGIDLKINPRTLDLLGSP